MAADIRKVVERAMVRSVQEHALWSPGARLVVAVSGGADSLCLLGALLALQKRRHRLAPRELIVAHFDHGVRGDESAEDARFVQRLAAKLGLPCIVERARTRHERGSRVSVEDWARHMRYAFLRHVAAEHHPERIVTGHTRDDQAETILLHWLRGSGLAGMRGMRPIRGDIARPLLDVTHAQTVGYCAALGWQPREDSSNRDPQYLRNRVRHELLPLLATYNPGIRDLLVGNGELLADDETYLETQTQIAWSQVAHVAPDSAGKDNERESVRVSLEPLRALPAAIRHRVYRAASSIVGNDFALEARHIVAIDRQLADGHSGTVLNLVGGLNTWLEYDALVFQRKGKHPAPQGPASGLLRIAASQPSEWTLTIPGVVEMPELGWRIRAWRVDGAPGSEDANTLPPAPELPPPSFTDRPAEIGRAESRVYLDAAATGDALTVRTWRPGDRFRPLGMRGEKKLQDYFSDAKVPRELRSRVPLVFNSAHLVWVAGLRIDDRVRLSPTTQAVIVLQLAPLTGQ
jgi:tRNA(Ile)-lysidine synthase